MKKSILKNKMTIIVTILCIIGMIAIIGYTYSFFAATVSDAVTIKGDAASPSVNLTISRVAPTEDKKLIPQLDTVIHKAVIGTQGNCLDDNNNAVCQVYKITVTNTSTAATYINGKVELDAKDNPHLKWAIVSGLSNTTLVSDIKTYEDTILTSSELYDGGEVKDYYVVLWISETGAPQTDSGSFDGVVTIENVAVSNLALVTLNNLGIMPETEVLTSFPVGEKLDNTTGVYAAEDDFGTSYYFRGNVTNNYVKFGKYTEDAWQVYNSSTKERTYDSTCTSGGNIQCTQIASAGEDMYWRIVRINGDGTIRMIYSGTSAHTNGYNEVETIGAIPYNITHNDNSYVGYMYGTVGSSTYEESHTNINDSTIKIAVDLWYEKYLSNYSNYIVDAIYCNDRTTVTDETKNSMLKLAFGLENQEIMGEGFGTKGTFYSLFDRISLEDGTFLPTLKCLQENDRFTKNATVGNIRGNGALTYPIGLITLDEIVFGGGFYMVLEDFNNDLNVNNDFYLYTGNFYWTMSPLLFMNNNLASNGAVYQGVFSLGFLTADGIEVRPVISIDKNAITGGTGISTDPFTVTSQ